MQLCIVELLKTHDDSDEMRRLNLDSLGNAALTLGEWAMQGKLWEYRQDNESAGLVAENCRVLAGLPLSGAVRYASR